MCHAFCLFIKNNMDLKTLTFFFLILNFVSGQDFNATETEDTKIKLCEVCTCSEIMNIDRTHVVLNVQCSLIHKLIDVPDLNKIEWPENPNNLKISTTFEGLRLSSLSKIPSNLDIETLTFTNDAIDTYWPDPFSDVPNLLKLTINQNQLVQITPDLFTNLRSLQELDLSFNKIAEFNPVTFKTLKKVRKLSLQGNKFNRIPIDALQPMSSLEDLDLSKNGIYDLILKRSEGESLGGIKWLSLNGNRIRSVMKDAFPENNSIEYLDLSNNLIEIIEEEAFSPCTNLRELNLAQNNITLKFTLPESLQIAIFKINTMYHMPKFPNGITYVDMSYNRLSEFYDSKSNSFENLEVLNIGGNQIKELTLQDKLPKLFSLDISFNLFQEIPDGLSSNNFPSLKELKLDGNPIETVYFKNIISLRNLYLNELNNLVSIEDKAFSNVIGRSVDETNDNRTCISLYLSNCKSLSRIARGAFDGATLCMLDLSDNKLAYIPPDLINWTSLTEGVDLQNNPWNCNCSLQWIIQDLMPLLYKRNPYLLNELRCGSPRGLQGLHFVHMYNWTEPVLCKDDYIEPIEGRRYMSQPSTQSIIPVMDTKNIIIVVSIVVLAIVAIILIIYIVVTKKYKRVRQPKRRQSSGDMNHNREQAVGLNKPLRKM